jgi:copper chaperone CopZ
MKQLSFLSCFALMLWVQGCSQPQQTESTVSIQDSNARVYEVFGMDCPGCHGGLEKLVKKIPAVKEAQANWQKQQLIVVVQPDAELDDEAIYDAVKRANFTPGKRIQ